MSERMSLVSFFSRMLRHNNCLTVCPPGTLPKSGDKPNIVVASLMRSGTHLAIDLILNNFREYRNVPLYVDLDQYLLSGKDVQALRDVKGCVFKTHWPQVDIPDFEDAVKVLCKDSIVILPKRELKDVSRSFEKFSSQYANVNSEVCSRFFEFWASFNPLIIPFEQMLSRNGTQDILQSISRLSGATCTSRIKYPPQKKLNRYIVYLAKALTRILGKYSPVINTTISYKI